MSILIPIAAATDRAVYGGKAANLAFLRKLGLDVPDGHVVPATELTRHLATGDASDLAVRPLRSELVSALRAIVTELGGRVSVRSSATLEDARTHSFAGQFQTILNVGPDGVEAAVRAVWASAHSDNVRAYLRRADLDPAALMMAVVIQRQIDSEASGVAMGASNGTIVEAVLGQGEGIVSGAITADHWEVDATKRVALARIASKSHRVHLPAGTPTSALARTTLTGAERTKRSLTDTQVLEIAAVCDRVTAACDGRKQDIEFAYENGKLHLLQTRDVTASLPIIAPPLGTFAPPAKGAWELDVNHFVRPATAIFQSIFPAACKAGFAKGTARYGALISHLDVEFVHGFPYTRLRPLAAPADATAKPPPPAWLFKLLCKVVPPLGKRIKTAAKTWANREWRVEAEEWKDVKARAIREHLRLQTVDLDKLDDAALIAHLEATFVHAAKMVEQHHTYNMATLVPVGDLLAHVAKWSDGKVADGDVFALLSGASPITADLTCEAARAIGATLAADATASRLLRLDGKDVAISDADATSALVHLRTLQGVGDFLAMRELRLVEGLDPGAPCLRECPALLWQALRSTALAAATPPTQDATAIDPAILARIRGAIPAAHHAELDALIEEARALAFLRDERALFSDVWAWGILRTAVLEIGRRIIKRDPKLLLDATDLIHANHDEILSLFTQSRGPSALELETRAAYRRAYTMRDAPATLGPKALPPPSPDLLPPAAARLMAGVLHVIPHILSPASEASAEAGMLGKAASSGIWEGPVHVVSSHDDARDIPAGAVLVVGASSSTFTMLAPLASAVVAEGGGLLSHVAIVCREYRIPCVCGVPNVLESLHSGQRVRVDGTRGTVELMS